MIIINLTKKLFFLPTLLLLYQFFIYYTDFYLNIMDLKTNFLLYHQIFFEETVWKQVAIGENRTPIIFNKDTKSYI